MQSSMWHPMDSIEESDSASTMALHEPLKLFKLGPHLCDDLRALAPECLSGEPGSMEE